MTAVRRSSMLAAAVLAGLSACGGSSTPTRPAAPVGVQQGDVSVGGVVRTYRLFVPPTIDSRRKAPLVIALHGAGNDVEDTVKTTQLDRFAATDEFVAAYPQGLKGYWNGGFCCGSASAEGVDDVGFLSALIDEVQDEYPVDPARVYLVGVSNGAIMAYRFACERAETVAAVASVAGAMMLDDCRPSRPVTILELHGTADRSVPYAGGPVQPRSAQAKAPVPSTTDVMHRWVDHNGCSPLPEASTDGPVTTTTWSGCRGATTVTLVTLQGGGHTWFAPGLGPVNGAIDASTVITGFLGRLRPAP